MTWMNHWEIDEARAMYADDPVLGPAVETLVALRDWTDQNSDGWHMWPKPSRAAAKLMALIPGRYENRTVTEAELNAALRPIKAFRTRGGYDFPIYGIGESPKQRRIAELNAEIKEVYRLGRIPERQLCELDWLQDDEEGEL